MSLPLLTRATEDGVTFVLTPRHDTATAAPLLPPPPAPRMPLRAPGPGRAVPLSRRHGEVHRLQVLRRRLQRAERQSRGDQLAARRRNRRRLVSARRAVVPVDGLQSLPRADLPAGLSGRRLHEGRRHRHRAAQRRRLHRLPVLHVELLVRRAAVQPRARRRRQVRHVPQPARPRPVAGVRVGLSERRDPDRNRQRRRAGARRPPPALPATGLPSGDQSISTTRITLPANLPPNAKPVDLVQLEARAIRTGRWS